MERTALKARFNALAIVITKLAILMTVTTKTKFYQLKDKTMHKFKRNCVAQQRVRIRQYYQRKKQAEQVKEPKHTKEAA